MLDARSTPYLSDILEQPRALDRALAGLREQPDMAPIAAAIAANAYGRVILTGMGSSFHALYPLHLLLTVHGLPSLHIETGELLRLMPALRDQRPLVVAVSQSGRSGEIVRLVSGDFGALDVIGVTNDPSSPLFERSRQALLLHAGVEATVSCKTYVTTLMALEWLAGLLTGGEMQQLGTDLSQASSATATYLADWQAHVAAITDALDGMRQVYFVGRGRSLAAAATAGLIFKEATRQQAEGMTASAFRHGPFEVLGPDVFVAVMDGDDDVGALNQRLVDDIRAADGIAERIGATPASIVPFRIPAAAPRIRPLLEILPVQMMTLAMASLRNHRAGSFSRAAKITVIE